MKLKTDKTKDVRVVLKDSETGKCISFTVYDVTKEALAGCIKKMIEES